MLKISKLCDQCKKELIVDSQYPANYTLELNVVNTGINTSSVEFAVHMIPPFDGTKHFCNKSCLSEWLKED